MIDRKIYLEMCQRVAMLPNGTLGIKKNIPDNLKVVYDGVVYYPLSLEISFNGDGEVINTAILHSLTANSVVDRNLLSISLFKDNLDKHK